VLGTARFGRTSRGGPQTQSRIPSTHPWVETPACAVPRPQTTTTKRCSPRFPRPFLNLPALTAWRQQSSPHVATSCSRTTSLPAFRCSSADTTRASPRTRTQEPAGTALFQPRAPIAPVSFCRSPESSPSTIPSGYSGTLYLSWTQTFMTVLAAPIPATP